jgi:SpoVK/Ycf46/Vps4 family AAA+-type ATPase
VGESEELINSLADRCDLIPWEICVLFVDEIDGLAPNRKSSDTANHKVDMLSVFLSIMDGNKTKPNLLIIGTSNSINNLY